MGHTLYTWGSGEILSTLFNAIAALINGKTGSLYTTLIHFGLMAGFMTAVLSSMYGNFGKIATHWVLPFYLLINLFFAPTTTIHIKDLATGGYHKVDHVPWGLGAFAGTVSALSYTLTQKIEAVFSLPDDLKYHKTGAMMASNLIAHARTFHITQTEVAETMKDFVNQCVVYDVLLGTKYTMDDLKNSPDIWKLVKEKASPARSFTYREVASAGKGQILTCKAGAIKLDALLNVQVTNAFGYFGPKLFTAKAARTGTSAVNPSALLKSYLPTAYTHMTKMAGTAQDIMRQQMMIYTVIDAVESKSTSLGNAPDFALRRAYLQQRANQENVAGLAQKTMIALKNMMEAIIYATFIFMLPLAMLPQGWRFVAHWAGMVLWVQMWGPLYAILNFMMNAAAQSKGLGVIATSGGITIANSVGFSDLHADMAAQAGYLSLSVGALAYALVKGGASSFMNLVSHTTGPLTGAASQATGDMMSGNYSFGNVSLGSVQANNETFGQHMLSSSYSSGAFSQNDGVISSVSGVDGSRMVNIANSNLRSSVQWGENLSSTFSEQANHALTASQSSLQAYSDSQSNAYRSALDFGTHMSQQKSLGDSVSQAEQASATASFSKLNSMVQQFADDTKISEEVARQMLGRASANLSTKDTLWGKALGGVLGISVGADMGYQKTWGGSKSQAWSKAQQLAQNASFQEALQKSLHYSQDRRFNHSDETAKRLGESVSSSSEQAAQYRHETQAHWQRAKSFSESASWAQQNSTSINASLNQEFVDWLPQQALPHSNGPMGRREADTLLASRPELSLPYQQRFMEERFGTLKQGLHHHETGSFAKVQQAQADFQQAVQRSPSSLSSDVLAQAKAAGLQVDAFEEHLTQREAHLKDGYCDYALDVKQGIQHSTHEEVDRSGRDLESVGKFYAKDDLPSQDPTLSANLFDRSPVSNQKLQQQMDDLLESHEKSKSPSPSQREFLTKMEGLKKKGS